MKRLAYMVFRLLFRIPGYLLTVKKYAKNKDKYSYEERFNFVRKVLIRAKKVSRTKVEVTGQENIPAEGAFLMTPNHQGMFDIVLLMSVLNRPFKIVAKKELQNVVVVGDALSFLEYPFIDRQNMRQSMQVIRQVKEEMAEGIPYVIFPEGTRSKQGNTLLDFKGGTYKPAIDNHLPIIPVAIINSFEVLDRNTLKKIDVKMHIFEPMCYDDYKDLKSKDIALKIQTQIQEYVDAHK